MKFGHIQNISSKDPETSKLPISESDTATENAGRAGMCLLEKTTDPLLFPPDIPLKEDPTENTNEIEVSHDLMDKLVSLADIFDLENFMHYANFTDFLIKKAAQIETDPSAEFRNSIIKLNESDIADKSDLIIKLTTLYSKTLLLNFRKTNDVDSAKRAAFHTFSEHLKNYLE